MPNYLINMVNAVMELHKETEALRSKGIISLKAIRGGSRKTEAISVKWLNRKKQIFDEVKDIGGQCRRLAGKIRFWLGYYDPYN